MQGKKIVPLLAAVVFIVFGCAGLDKTTRTGEIHTIRIDKTLSKQNLTVQAGDEIRWINLRTEPVLIEFTPDAIGSFSCENGFSNMFGKLRAYTQIGASQSASLCFSREGEYKYNARMTAAVAGGETIVSGTITVKK